MTSLTLLLFVDAFRPDYLRDAPYLAGLAGRSASGRLREPFGFLPHAAYFGGLSPEQVGFTNLLCCDPARSPFAVARWLPKTAFTTEKTAAQIRRYVDEQARSRVSAFAASYASSLNIPGELLAHFAVAEPEAPWSSKAGYRSIFQELDARGDRWFASAWPATNDLPDHSDAGIVAHAQASLGPEHRFAHIHLQELDAAGHWFGPEGAGLRRLVRQTDGVVEELIAWLRVRYDDLNVIIFGDHGMVSVTRAVDVRPALAATALVPGVDYVYFLDSTMVRLWFLTSRSRVPLLQALSQVRGLRFVTPEDKTRHRIAGCHPSNAHEIFLAEPGVVIAPDFFTRGSAHPIGMHGYDPDCADNQGLFIAHGDGVPPGDAGIVDATEIYDWTRELLGLVPPRPDRVSPIERASARRFTQSHMPLADACVGEQLDRVIEQLQVVTARAEAIVLTGSFGRGEGGTVATGSTISAVNDFDVLVVGGPDISRELASMGPGLATHVGLDFLDLAWTDGQWTDVPATMLNLDLRYGSQVLKGSSEVLARMPMVSAAEISMQDALILLLNRIGGLLSGLNGRMLCGLPAADREKRYLFNQVVKALVAVGDTYLVEWHAYDASYRARRERFSCLATGAGVPAAVRDAIDSAYRLKVYPDYDELPDPACAAVSAGPLVLERLCVVAAATLGRPIDSIRPTSEALRSVSGEWVAVDNARLLEREEIAEWCAQDVDPRQSIRQAIYAALPLLLAAVSVSDFDPACPLALPSIGEGLRMDTESTWESGRAALVSAWLAMNH